MNEQFLPTDFNGKLWHFAEEIGEVLYVVRRWNLLPPLEHIPFEILTNFHKAACKMGRFGPRADLTGTAMKLNNARDMLERWDRLQAAILLLHRIRHELQGELEDLERAAEALRLELVTMT